MTLFLCNPEKGLSKLWLSSQSFGSRAPTIKEVDCRRGCKGVTSGFF